MFWLSEDRGRNACEFENLTAQMRGTHEIACEAAKNNRRTREAVLDRAMS